MKRLITATLTQALITDLFAGEAFASNVNNTMHQKNFPNVIDLDDCPSIGINC